MNKLLKTLLPIGSAVALAPTICLASCGFMSGTMTCDEETADGNFTITFIFKEEVPADQRGWYTFSCLNGATWIGDPAWDADNKTVTFANASLDAELVSGKRYSFTFHIHYESEGDVVEVSDEDYPGRITYIGK